MFSDNDKKCAAKLAEIQITTVHQLNALHRIQRTISVLAIASVICAIALCWPFFVSLVTLGLGLLLITHKFIPDTWPYFLALFACYSIFILWLEHRPDPTSRLKSANWKRIEEIRKKRNEQMEADMASYFEKKRAHKLKAPQGSNNSNQETKP